MAERHRSRGRIVMAALACAVSMLLLAFFVPAGHAATTDSQKFRDVARQEGLDIEEATVSECADALQGMGATDADISECLVAVDSNGSFTAAYVGATSDLVSTVRYACSHAQSMASSSATVTQFGSGYKVEGDDSGATGYLYISDNAVLTMTSKSYDSKYGETGAAKIADDSGFGANAPSSSSSSPSQSSDSQTGAEPNGGAQGTDRRIIWIAVASGAAVVVLIVAAGVLVHNRRKTALEQVAAAGYRAPVFPGYPAMQGQRQFQGQPDSAWPSADGAGYDGRQYGQNPYAPGWQAGSPAGYDQTARRNGQPYGESQGWPYGG
ncbi:hypothetical protein PSRA_0396 [Pseudoscardovia radai]|uniref:Uncharacterized protein n=2 Tax=Pseudoscardovia radai TaxID=987066 RepID=A0A261F0K6_9BIFI|nr:hypothetical protein PSRA_0396 [Pseudoscardovia radai]